MKSILPLFLSKVRPIIFTLSILFLSSGISKGQNYLMNNESNSFHGAGQFSINSFENYYALLTGYTFKGRLSVGFDLGKNKDLVNKLNSTVFRPNVSYLILKQEDERLPISLDINVAYQYNYVTQLIFNTRSVQFGVGLYHEINPLENVKIIPSIFFRGDKPTAGPNPQFMESVAWSYGAQTIIAWNNYYLTPKYILQDGVSTISVQVGMIFNADAL